MVQAHQALKACQNLPNNVQWTWAVAEPYIDLIKDEELVHQLMAVPRKWSLKKWFKFKAEGRHHHFDLIIDAQCLLKSWLVTKALSHEKSLSWGPEMSRDLLTPKLYKHQLNHGAVSSRSAFLNLVTKGLSLLDGLKWSEHSSATAPLTWEHKNIKLKDDFKIYCALGAGWRTKQLNIQQWKLLIHAIRKDCPTQDITFLKGSELENTQLKELERDFDQLSIKTLPKLNLKDLKAILQPRDLFIGMDSGPTHLASSSGLLTLSFFGPSLPEAYDASDSGVHAVRGKCHLNETFHRRCDLLRKCQDCSAISSIDPEKSWKSFWAEHGLKKEQH